MYVMQRGDRGLANTIGTPVDIVAGLTNMGLFGADKLAQLFGEHLVGHSLEVPFEFVVPPHPVLEPPEDRHLPLASQGLQGQLDWIVEAPTINHEFGHRSLSFW